MKEVIKQIARAVFYSVCFAIGFVAARSCSSAHGATYGNDVAATSVVVATATTAADTTRGGK